MSTTIRVTQILFVEAQNRAEDVKSASPGVAAHWMDDERLVAATGGIGVDEVKSHAPIPSQRVNDGEVRTHMHGDFEVFTNGTSPT